MSQIHSPYDRDPQRYPEFWDNPIPLRTLGIWERTGDPGSPPADLCRGHVDKFPCQFAQCSVALKRGLLSRTATRRQSGKGQRITVNTL